MGWGPGLNEKEWAEQQWSSQGSLTERVMSGASCLLLLPLRLPCNKQVYPQIAMQNTLCLFCPCSGRGNQYSVFFLITALWNRKGNRHKYGPIYLWWEKFQQNSLKTLVNTVNISHKMKSINRLLKCLVVLFCFFGPQFPLLYWENLT